MSNMVRSRVVTSPLMNKKIQKQTGKRLKADIKNQNMCREHALPSEGRRGNVRPGRR